MKLISKIGFGLVLVILIGIALFYTLLPSIVSHSLSEKSQVEVSIEGISIGLDSIKVKSLFIGNPPHSILPQALKVSSIVTESSLRQFFKPKIIIPEMHLKGIYLGLEFNSKADSKGNWTFIMQNLNAANQSTENSSTEVLIKKLTLSDLTCQIAYRDQPKNIQTISIPSIEFTNVSSTGGIPTAQIMQLVMQQALQQIFSKQNLQNMIKDVITPQNNGVFDSFKGLFSISIEGDEPIQMR